MKISINGKMQSFDKEVLTFETLIKEINLEGRRFAIHRNGEIIPISHFNSYTLHDGYKLEIIGAVGGG